MRVAIASLKSVSPYSQSRPVAGKERDETHDEHDLRAWRERCHVDDDGNCFIPPMAFKNCLSEAAKYKSMKIPGQGTSTYTKHIEAGIICKEPMPLGVKLGDVKSERLFVPADGRRGGKTRVWKTFPIFHHWEGDVEFLVLDEKVPKEIFELFLTDAGQFIGVGRFRPRNNGYYGRFEVSKVVWSNGI